MLPDIEVLAQTPEPWWLRWQPKFWKMGTKLDSLKVLSAFGWLSGAPLCSLSGPKEPKDHEDGVRVKWLSHSPRMAYGREKPVEGVQKWVIWDVLPALVEKQSLGQAVWDSGNCVHAHPIASSREMDHCVPPAGYLASRLVPPDLVPRPETHSLFFSFKRN